MAAMGFVLRVCIVISLVVQAVVSSSCTSAGPSVQAATPDNLLLVTIDTIRADRVGIYGHAAARTGALDGLARSGVRFTQVYAPAPITLTSHATLMTGLNPPSHGARHNGMRVRDDAPTLAAAFAAAGFKTAAFVSAFPLTSRFGLARGFTTYDAALPRQEDGRPLNERPDAATADAAVRWLGANRDSRFFLWHSPACMRRDGDARDSSTTMLERYDAEIAESDRQVGRLIDTLGETRARTLVVVAGDHGEAFGEHGEIGHSVFVYDVTLRVPLIMSGPGVPDTGRQVEEPVGLVDVAATARALFGQAAVPGDGIDLRSLVSGGRVAPRALYAESFAPLIDFGWSPLRSIRAGTRKYIAVPRPELYDMASDAAESRNRVGEAPEEAVRLATAVDAITAASLSTPISIDPEAAARLGSLGYVSSNRSVRVQKPGPDPKDRIAVAGRLAAVTSGEVPAERLVATLEDLLREEPENPQAELRLGVALAERGQCDRADVHLRRAIASNLPTADPFISLAFCLQQQGDYPRAVQTLRDAKRREPGNAIVDANLGIMAFEAGRMDEAIEELAAAVEHDPDLHQARFFLARAYARSGQRAAAEAQARTLLERLPATAPQRKEVERLVAALR